MHNIKKLVNNLVTEDKGCGEVILFLHGYMSCKESFNYQTEYFSKFYRTIAPDLLGFGESPKLESIYNLDNYVSDTIKLINELKIEKYHIIAHSFGGRIALKLATLDKRVDKIIITGGAGLKPRRSIFYYIRVRLYKILTKLFRNKDFSFLGSKEYRKLDYIDKRTYVNIVNEHLDNLLKNVKNKVLLIYGKSDKSTPLYMAKKMNKEIQNSRLEVLKGGHFCFIDNHLTFNEIVHNFIK